jgi:hypothetical protein
VPSSLTGHFHRPGKLQHWGKSQLATRQEGSQGTQTLEIVHNSFYYPYELHSMPNGPSPGLQATSAHAAVSSCSDSVAAALSGLAVQHCSEASTWSRGIYSMPWWALRVLNKANVPQLAKLLAGPPPPPPPKVRSMQY